MKILVTGGTGVIGAGLIPELLRQNHTVRLLSRKAQKDARQYSGPLEAFPADVTDPLSLRNAADGCDAVVHITGIVQEAPPEVTFDRINVHGTINVLAEATASAVKRFVYMSSLGADVGQSDYHHSKLRAEEVVREFPGEWVILRPGAVYGPGDEVISVLLKMVRTLPVVPVVESGSQPFQPIWFMDLGKAILAALERPDVAGRVLELAGTEVTTTSDILDRFGAITGRAPKQLPTPAWLAEIGTKTAELFGIESIGGVSLPINSAKLDMLLEGNLIRDEKRNALSRVLRVTPTRLDEGLMELADSLPELLPEEGVGGLERKRFWADIIHSKFSPAETISYFRVKISEIMPLEFEAEPGVASQAEQGTTLTGAIPGRGNFQVRVQEATDHSLTLSTIQGHPLAGTVTFRAVPAGESMRFEVEIYARAANVFDWVALRTVRPGMQNQNWREVVRRVVEATGGQAPEGVHTESVTLTEADARKAEEAAFRIVVDRHREEQAHPTNPS